MNWTTSCTDWERRIVAGESLIPFEPLFPGEAQAALDVFQELRIVDVPGQPTMGQACRQWVFDFVSSIFGAYDPESGRRLITEFFLLISKKNTKSTTAAGIMLTALLLNWRHSAEFLILAPTIEVANNSFIPARDMIKADNELDALLHVQPNLRTITHRTNKATLKIVAADNETVSGKKATGVLIDELWLFGKKPNAENMLREACGGLASRPEGFVIFLSTQSDEAPAGVFAQKLDYARGVRDGRIADKSLLPVIYEFPQQMIKAGLHKDSKNFYITNPNLGTSVDIPFIEREYMKAENAGEASMLGFLSKHLNVQVGVTLREKNWTGAEFWEKQGQKHITLDYIIENSDVLEIGIDGGGMDDMTGFCVIGRHSSTGTWMVWVKAWIYRSALKVRKSEAPRYLDFESDGDLEILDNPTVDQVSELSGISVETIKKIKNEEHEASVEQLDAISIAMAEIAKEKIKGIVDIALKCEYSGLLDTICVDPIGLGIIDDAIKREMLENNIDIKDKIIGVKQGYNLSGSIKTVEVKLAEGTLVHGGCRLMNWCVGNAKQELKGNAISITKQISGTAKIDPLVALFTAAEMMCRNPEPRSGRSTYEDHGILTF